MLNYIFYISHVGVIMVLSYYLMTCMQWYSYRFTRVVFHFSKPLWHLYFCVSLSLFYFASIWLKFEILFLLYFYAIYLPTLYLWYKKQDKKLVFTKRVKRFFVILIFAILFFDMICFVKKCENFAILMPVIVSFVISNLYERFIFANFYKQAQGKIAQNEKLKIISITASFGKTSIKNFLFEILKDDFKCYKTPRSVNTLAGLVLDINTALPSDTQLYITEAGARQKGDIDEIARFLNPHVAIIGEIGEQHIEYFKSLENIRDTKMELLSSNRLQKSYLHKSTNAKAHGDFVVFADEIVNVKSSIDGTYFTLRIDGKNEEFFTPILGEFNVTNLCVCVLVALDLGVELQKIKQKISNLKSVEHRLQRIDAGGKIIIDDSFNGNFNGMSSSYKLISSYQGRKILITPGIVESTKEDNENLAKIANEIFDVVIITGKLNAKILANMLNKPEVMFLEQKSKMQDLLAKVSKKGDLILFSNDAPEFI